MPTKREALSYAKATVEIYFPNEKICCALCPLMQTYARKQCMRTGELIADDRGIGAWCPLEFEEEKIWESQS